MFNFIESAKPALDKLASTTGLRLVPDPLLHLGGQDTCILDIAAYRQIESYTCGFVAGAMVLHTFRPKASLTKFFAECSPDIDKGLSTTRLVRCLRANRIGVGYRRNLDFEKIVDLIDSGYPIITLTKTADEEVEHWVVLHGYGRNPNRVFIAGEGVPLLNNLTGEKEIVWTKFYRSKWAEAGFGLVCWGK